MSHTSFVKSFTKDPPKSIVMSDPRSGMTDRQLAIHVTRKWLESERGSFQCFIQEFYVDSREFNFSLRVLRPNKCNYFHLSNGDVSDDNNKIII